MTFRLILLLICLQIIKGYSIVGQSIKFQNISTTQGLSQNSVVSIAQDTFGFMWFATQDGINKYDGSHFEQLEAYFQDVTAKTYSRLGKCYFDSENTLWITTLNGKLEYYDKTLNALVPVSGIPNASNIIQIGKDAYLVGSFTHGLYKLTIARTSDRLDVESIFNIEPNVSIYKFTDFENEIYLSTNRGVFVFDKISGYVNLLFKDQISAHVSDVIFDTNHNMLISTFGDGLFISTDKENIQRHPDLKEPLIIQDIHLDQMGRLWIATFGDGAFKVETNEVIQFRNEAQNKYSIKYNDILCIFEDSYGNIWFGTDGVGVSLINSDQKPIFGVTNDQVPDNIEVDIVRSICTDKNDDIWVGTYGKGMTRFSSDLKDITYYSTSSSGIGNISTNRILTLYNDDENRVWIGSQGGGLLLANDKYSSIQEIACLPNCKSIFDIHKAGENHLWLACDQLGMVKVNLNTKMCSDNDWRLAAQSIANINVRVISSGDRENTFYLGLEDGNVVEFDHNVGSIQVLPIESSRNGRIKSLYNDGNYLWIGTQQAGLIKYEKDSQSFQFINKSNGLPNNVIYAILPQGNDYLWISTNKGICQLVKKKLIHGDPNVVNQFYDSNNGLVSNEFNTGASHKDENGKLYFGAIDGINWFDPKDMVEDKSPVELEFLSLIITNQEGKEVYPILGEQGIKLNYYDRNFQIKYSSLDYSNNTRTLYKYKLDGINEEWINNESNDLVSFSNVPPGKYSFLLNATNKDGLWNTQPNKFYIEIVPAIWQQNWFIVMLVLLGLIGVYCLYNLRINQIKRTSDLQQQINLAETKALKSQMNPHFLFNSLNTIDHYILKNNPETASDYLSKFSKLVRQILDSSELSSITLARELEILKLYLKMEQMRFPNKFNFKINLMPDIDLEKIKLPPMILQPFVENAIWHGLLHKETVGHLYINIFSTKSHLIIEIDDDGIGRKGAEIFKSKTATRRKSYGVKITQERIRLINELSGLGGKMKTEDKYNAFNQSKGTKVTISLPLKRSKVLA